MTLVSFSYFSGPSTLPPFWPPVIRKFNATPKLGNVENLIKKNSPTFTSLVQFGLLVFSEQVQDSKFCSDFSEQVQDSKFCSDFPEQVQDSRGKVGETSQQCLVVENQTTTSLGQVHLQIYFGSTWLPSSVTWERREI